MTRKKDSTQEIEDLKKQIQILSSKLDVYETAADGAQDGLWDYDFIEGQAFVSKPWKTMLGLDENLEVEKHGDLWRDLLHPDDLERATTYLDNFVKSKNTIYLQEFRLLHADGNYRWILSKGRAIRNEKGQILRLSGAHTDITENKTSQRKIKKSQEKYKNLFQNSLVGMFRSEFSTGKVIDSNDKFWEILGAPRMKGLRTTDFYIMSKDRNMVLDVAKSTGAAKNIELQLKRYDGKKIWVAFNTKYYPEEEILETVVIDITETKNNLLELKKVNFELDSFVYHASHDLRSPLRSILGLIDVYRLETSEKIRERCIEKIESSVLRLDDLVQELLSLSRNERINDEKKEVNLLVEINNSIASYYNVSDTSGLTIYCKVDSKLKFVTDATRLRIIINNIISNAIKYRSHDRQESFIKIEARVTKRQAIITIEDNGEGINQSKLPHIFDMFYRATEKSVGSGLGLYIVNKVAEKLKAKIDVKSNVDKGTTFTIKVPNLSTNK